MSSPSAKLHTFQTICFTASGPSNNPPHSNNTSDPSNNPPHSNNTSPSGLKPNFFFCIHFPKLLLRSLIPGKFQHQPVPADVRALSALQPFLRQLAGAAQLIQLETSAAAAPDRSSDHTASPPSAKAPYPPSVQVSLSPAGHTSS